MSKSKRFKFIRGVEAKVLQYEQHAKSSSKERINLNSLLSDLLGKKIEENYVIVNLAKDTERYKNTLEELKKISASKFVHLHGTYWKDKTALEEDLSYILSFLKRFNPKIKNTKVTINEFSEISDKNIHIQDGPLGCFCSHVRAMIHGYLNFEDYSATIEDDISITNAKKIKKYIGFIPDDWDIICLNSAAKNKVYKKPYYKFTDEFHSTHFYIIRHRSFPFIFKHLYPITDQIDVLLSDQIRKINVYNIPDTVYQKNISTNTQNNLHVIFNSPHYVVVRKSLNRIKKLCGFFINKTLPNNKQRNSITVLNLMYDVLYEYILSDAQSNYSDGKVGYLFDNSEYKKHKEYEKLLEEIEFFLQCSKKGIREKYEAESLLNVILYTIHSFDLHGKEDKWFKEKAKAYSFGSTSYTYLLPKNKIIVKKYNDKLRWTTKGHDNSEEIFKRELDILKKTQHLDFVPRLILYDPSDKTLHMSYCGVSLYDQFSLPRNWKSQIRKMFVQLTESRIFYQEFRLHNILVLDGKLSFIDFGLARFDEKADNKENCEKFIKLLSIIDKKFSSISDVNKRYQLYSTFIKNLERKECQKS